MADHVDFRHTIDANLKINSEAVSAIDAQSPSLSYTVTENFLTREYPPPTAKRDCGMGTPPGLPIRWMICCRASRDKLARIAVRPLEGGNGGHCARQVRLYNS